MKENHTHLKAGNAASRDVSRSEWTMEQANRMCFHKQRFPDKKSALTYLNDVNRRKRGRHGRPEALRAYCCPICHCWHLTKKGVKR